MGGSVDRPLSIPSFWGRKSHVCRDSLMYTSHQFLQWNITNPAVKNSEDGTAIFEDDTR